MKNKIFKIFLWLNLILTMVFLTGLLLALVVKGCAYVIPALRSEEIIFSIKMSLKTSIFILWKYGYW